MQKTKKKKTNGNDQDGRKICIYKKKHNDKYIHTTDNNVETQEKKGKRKMLSIKSRNERRRRRKNQNNIFH